MPAFDHLKNSLPILSDHFGRRVSYLRISMTDRCNLRCVYCMPESSVPYEQPGEILTLDEIMRLVNLLTAHGLTKVRLTGGEPLVRSKDVIELIGRISKIKQISDLGLTTNAVLLAPLVHVLRDSGLERINISLDTLRRERFVKIARMDKFDDALAGLSAAEAVGFDPIKLNMVVMRGINDDEILDFARMTLSKDYQVRFLEYMPIGQVSHYEWRAKYVDIDEIMSIVCKVYSIEEQGTCASSTSRVYKLKAARGQSVL
jgi:cyclic pyranopterin phosphate synthase